MKKYVCATIFSIAWFLSIALSVSAQQVPAIQSMLATQPTTDSQQSPMRQSGYVSKTVAPIPVLSEDTIKLDAKQKKGVSLADQWKEKPALPFLAEDGSIQFIYGSTLPSVVCAPLYACDVALQPGEVIRQVMLGDASRWKVSPGTSGSGENLVAHIVIKPSDTGLSTNVVIHTDRRSYNIRLVSKKDQWMPLVSFAYPDDTQAQWTAYQQEGQQQARARARTRPVATITTNTDLNFNYRIRGNAPLWKPIRVYSDQNKTYIQFPSKVKDNQAPALVVLDAGKREQLVNYRMVDDRYVVDQVIDKAALIRGVGRRQERIEIAREGSQS